MNQRYCYEETLAQLDCIVADAIAFFSEADESLTDGYQSVREVLSHLVFWHREYVNTARALVNSRKPELKSGSFATLNETATREFANRSLPCLAKRLGQLQATLAATLRCLPDWSVSFPIKQGGRVCSVAERVPMIESHIRHHVNRLQRADRLGEAWVRAYFGERV